MDTSTLSFLTKNAILKHKTIPQDLFFFLFHMDFL